MIGNSLPRVVLCLVLVCALSVQFAEGQIVQRLGDGGVAVRAPRLGIDLRFPGPAGAQGAVAAADAPVGGGPFGIGRRILRRQRRAEQRLAALRDEKAKSVGQVDSKPPTLAEAPPLPSSADLAAMDLNELVSTLRDLTRNFDQELAQFDNPEGWQQYLNIPDDFLGSPGVDRVAVKQEELEKRLARYQKVSSDSSYTKIARMPSFLATREALELIVERSRDLSPVTTENLVNNDLPRSPETLASNDKPETASKSGPRLIQPTPAVPPNPEPRSGERSILLKRR